MRAMKPKRSYAAKPKAPSALDMCQTPPYALEPILRYLPRPAKKTIIWEPACGEGILANALRVAGFRVVESDLALGQDFFEYEPHKWDILITNPPWGIKPEWMRRCYELAKPFFLLMQTEFQGTGACSKLARQYGLRIMNLDKRVDFLMPDKRLFSNAQMPASWYQHDGLLLPLDLMWNVLNKPKRTVWRKVLKKDKKSGLMKLVTEWGYSEKILRPIDFDWTKYRYVYEPMEVEEYVERSAT